jgi:hypothetical protein
MQWGLLMSLKQDAGRPRRFLRCELFSLIEHMKMKQYRRFQAVSVTTLESGIYDLVDTNYRKILAVSGKIRPFLLHLCRLTRRISTEISN